MARNYAQVVRNKLRALDEATVIELREEGRG